MGGQGCANTVTHTEMTQVKGVRVPASFEPVTDHPTELHERGYQFVVRVARRLLRASKIDVTVYGAEHIPVTGGALIAANHTGYYDFILVGVGPHLRGNRLVRFMAKKSVFDVPVLGHLLRAMGHVPVNRAAGASAIDAAVAGLEQGRIVGIFPEATISRSFELAQFKTGAVRIAHAAGVPLVPCVIWGSQRIWTKDLPKQLRNVPVIIRYGTPIALTGDAERDTAALKHEMQSLLDASRDQYTALTHPPAGSSWMPAALGGTAPTPAQAEELYRQEREARAAKREANKQRRKWFRTRRRE